MLLWDLSGSPLASQSELLKIQLNVIENKPKIEQEFCVDEQSFLFSTPLRMISMFQSLNDGFDLECSINDIS